MSTRFTVPSHVVYDNDDCASPPCSFDYTQDWEEDEDDNFDDWTSDEAATLPCRSLFEDKTFPTAKAALEHDNTVHGFNLEDCCKKLSACFLSQTMRATCSYFRRTDLA